MKARAATVLLLLAGAAGAQTAAAADDPDWFACAKDADCVVTLGYCTAVAVNAKHQAAHAAKVAEQTKTIGPTATCITSAAEAGVKAVCDNGQCVTRPRKRPGRR